MTDSGQPDDIGRDEPARRAHARRSTSSRDGVERALAVPGDDDQGCASGWAARKASNAARTSR